MYRLSGGNKGRLFVVVSARIVVAVEIGEVAARHVHPDAVPTPEEIARRMKLDCIFIRPTRLNQGRVDERVTVPGPDNTVAEFLNKAIRPYVH